MNSYMKSLTEGIVGPDRRKESAVLVEKWNKTGLLSGLKDVDNNPLKSNMARLLENQAGQLLREASQVADIQGFQNVAFPIVRRVFAGLIANELVKRLAAAGDGPRLVVGIALRVAEADHRPDEMRLRVAEQRSRPGGKGAGCLSPPGRVPAPPRAASSAGKPKADTAGVAFSLVTFFWPRKRK